MTFPIPAAALDDRLAFVGTTGAGKTYAATAAIEHLFAKDHRVIAVDPLGVMWGLRLCADGHTAAPWKPVIFGGEHGDLPINEHAGALIGEAVATSRESCIVDLSLIGTRAGERRFMLAFFSALYRCTDKSPVHLVVDEADMFAPQRILDKDGESMKLLGVMENIVRRGRVKGFIPWLVTQRPAVLSKNVLSQVDGLVALKLTAPHDRDALKGWVESTAGKGDWATLDAALPTLQRGDAVLWIPGRGTLGQVHIPPKATFDSSRTPKRGEKVRAAALPPLDLGALKEKLAGVEAEAKANDPKVLRGRIVELERQLAAKPKPAVAPSAIDHEAIALRRHATGFHEGWSAAWTQAHKEGFDGGVGLAKSVVDSIRYVPPKTPEPSSDIAPPKPAKIIPQNITEPRSASVRSTGFPKTTSQVNGIPSEGLSRPQQAILDALAWLDSVGVRQADRPRVAALANVSHRSSTFDANLSALKALGLLTYPSKGVLALTDQGGLRAEAVRAPLTTAALQEAILHKLDPYPREILRAVIGRYPDPAGREDIAQEINVSSKSSTFDASISTLKAFGFLEYPERGVVRAADLLFLGA